jgi:hypothetical protein
MYKILVVVESIDVENSSGAKANVSMINNLKSAGFELLVYHYSFKDIKLSGISCITIKEKKWNGLYFLSRLERQIRYLFRIKLYKILENSFGFSFTLFNDRNSIIAALGKIKDFNFDLILTLSQGGRFRPHHAVLKIPEFHNKWMAYIHDPYPMHLFPPPYFWKEPGFAIKEKFIMEVAEKSAINAFPSQLLMEWMGRFYPHFIKKGMVIPHQLEKKKELTIELPDFFNPAKFNIVHAGNLLWGRDPIGLINGFIKFLKSKPEASKDVRLLFLGGKSHYSTILKDYEANIHQIYVGENYLPFVQSQEIQKLSAINVILEAKAEISPFLPGKFPHCIMADKPILLLGPPKSESRRLLGEDYKYWAEIDNEKKISQLIGNLYEQWQLGIKETLSRKDVEEYLSPVYLKEKILMAINKVKE